jgi:hypothetical protein
MTLTSADDYYVRTRAGDGYRSSAALGCERARRSFSWSSWCRQPQQRRPRAQQQAALASPPVRPSADRPGPPRRSAGRSATRCCRGPRAPRAAGRWWASVWLGAGWCCAEAEDPSTALLVRRLTTNGRNADGGGRVPRSVQYETPILALRSELMVYTVAGEPMGGLGSGS